MKPYLTGTLLLSVFLAACAAPETAPTDGQESVTVAGEDLAFGTVKTLSASKLRDGVDYRVVVVSRPGTAAEREQLKEVYARSGVEPAFPTGYVVSDLLLMADSQAFHQHIADVTRYWDPTFLSMAEAGLSLIDVGADVACVIPFGDGAETSILAWVFNSDGLVWHGDISNDTPEDQWEIAILAAMKSGV